MAKFVESSLNSFQSKKCQNTTIKAKFESPKHLHQTTFETLKYPKQCFETASLDENVKCLNKKKP
jgi:hypothetical protein